MQQRARSRALALVVERLRLGTGVVVHVLDSIQGGALLVVGFNSAHIPIDQVHGREGSGRELRLKLLDRGVPNGSALTATLQTSKTADKIRCMDVHPSNICRHCSLCLTEINWPMEARQFLGRHPRRTGIRSGCSCRVPHARSWPLFAQGALVFVTVDSPVVPHSEEGPSLDLAAAPQIVGDRPSHRFGTGDALSLAEGCETDDLVLGKVHNRSHGNDVNRRRRHVTPGTKGAQARRGEGSAATGNA